MSEIKVEDRVVSETPHANYNLACEGKVFQIPEGLSFDKATFFSLSSTALQGIRKAGIEIGDSVVILGQGLVGQLALQLAKLSGAVPLIGVDLYDSRLDISSKGGANYTLNPRKVNLKEKVREITRGKGVKVVIEATGSPEAVPMSFELAGRFGRIILLASARGESRVNFYSLVHCRGILVIGAHDYFTRPRYESFHGWWKQRDDSELVLNLLNKRLLKVKDLKKIIECKKSVLGVILDWA